MRVNARLPAVIADTLIGPTFGSTILGTIYSRDEVRIRSHRFPWHYGVLLLLGGLALSSAGCKGDAYRESDATPVSVAAPVHSVTVSWTANREHAVNKSGGGYRVYYSTTPGFSVSGASYVDVPYVSGGTAPVSTPITGLVAGTYYIKVVAYSAISAASAPSTEATVTVP